MGAGKSSSFALPRVQTLKIIMLNGVSHCYEQGHFIKEDGLG
jgi:hypothetical protein